MCKIAIAVLFMTSCIMMMSQVSEARSLATNKWTRMIYSQKHQLGLSSMRCTPPVFRACQEIAYTCRPMQQKRRDTSHVRRHRGRNGPTYRPRIRRVLTKRSTGSYSVRDYMTVKPRVNCAICQYLC